MALSTMFKITTKKNCLFNIFGYNLTKNDGFKKFLLKRCSSLQSPRPFQTTKKAMEIMKKDLVAPPFELVYRNPVSKYLGIAQWTSLTCGALLAGLAGFYSQLSRREDEYFGPQNSSETVFLVITLIGICISLQYIALKSPLRLYSDGKKFIIVRHGLLGTLGPIKKSEFAVGAGKLAKPSYFSTWNHARYEIDGRVYFIWESNFRTNADYLAILGLK